MEKASKSKNRVEVWKDIPDFEGMYQVSNKGRVKSLERWVGARNNKKRKMKSKILKPWKNKQEYWEITLYKNSKSHHMRLNRVVAIVFIPNPLHLPEVNHLSEIKSDNSEDNLEWCTSLYNKHYSMELHKDDPNWKKRKRKIEDSQYKNV